MAILCVLADRPYVGIITLRVQSVEMEDGLLDARSDFPYTAQMVTVSCASGAVSFPCLSLTALFSMLYGWASETAFGRVPCPSSALPVSTF
jgi:hypothetical protein